MHTFMGLPVSQLTSSIPAFHTYDPLAVTFTISNDLKIALEQYSTYR
jgi:hypothetical protein